MWGQVQAAGTLSGTLNVSGSGAATYNVPLQLPPGIAGMEPTLSLNYNSQQRAGKAGNGWDLEGLSSIYRCPRTRPIDGVHGAINFDMNDRFCLNGHRLVLVSGSYGSPGSEYRTERDQFIRIIANGASGNGPSHFVAQTKSGLSLQFGATDDSRIEAQGKTTVRTWALNKVSDIRGNYWSVKYYEDVQNPEFYPTQIDYTGTPTQASTASIAFQYEARPEVITAYEAGSVMKTALRLKSIQTAADGNPVHQYKLAYLPNAGAQSFLSGITQCAAESCLPPLSIQYSDSSFQQFAISAPFPNTGYGVDANNYRYLAGDFNGDGRIDVVHVVGSYVHVWHSNGNGTFDIRPPFSIPYNEGHFEVGDFNGDGNADLASITSSGVVLMYSLGDGQFHVPKISETKLKYEGYGIPDHRTLVGDFNGDGRSDLLHLANNSYVHVWLSGSVGDKETGITSAFDIRPAFPNNGYAVASNDYKFLVGDFNGDGRSDLVHFVSNDYVVVWTSNGDGTFQTSGPFPNSGYGVSSNNYNFLTGDFNGDGKTDLVHFVGNDYVVVWTSKGDSTFQLGPAFPNSGYGVSSNNYKFKAGDFNGDGKTDLIHFVSDRYAHIWLSNGDGTFSIKDPFPNTGYGVGSNNYNYITGDFNGDGKADLLHLVGPTYALVWSAAPVGVAGHAIDFSTTGKSVKVQHKPVSGGANYTSDPAEWVRGIPSFYVADRVESRVDNQTAVVSTYAYGGFKIDRLNGRGSLGFKWRTEKNQSSNLEAYTEMRQDWPYTGIVAKTESRLAGAGNGGILARTTHTYSSGPGSASPAIYVFRNKTVQEGWDINGSVLPVNTDEREYAQNPQYGDPTKIVLSTGDGGSKTSINEYWPVNISGGNWILGRLRKSTLTSVTP